MINNWCMILKEHSYAHHIPQGYRLGFLDVQKDFENCLWQWSMHQIAVGIKAAVNCSLVVDLEQNQFQRLQIGCFGSSSL
jgi:hypothetical protein